jgi:hypothetical protein
MAPLNKCGPQTDHRNNTPIEGKTPSPVKIAAKQLETTALAKAGITNPMIGKLLDTFA